MKCTFALVSTVQFPQVKFLVSKHITARITEWKSPVISERNGFQVGLSSVEGDIPLITASQINKIVSCGRKENPPRKHYQYCDFVFYTSINKTSNILKCTPCLETNIDKAVFSFWHIL